MKRTLSRLMFAGAVALAAVGLAPAAFAQAASPAGLWKSIDDETRQPKALIRITDSSGVINGRIEKILTDKPDAVCEACSGELKDKPVQGMQILQGLKADGDWYEGGTILDPNNGKVYKAKLRVVDGGAKLEVRGVIGISLLGRTQTWLREQ